MLSADLPKCRASQHTVTAFISPQLILFPMDPGSKENIGTSDGVKDRHTYDNFPYTNKPGAEILRGFRQ